MFADRAALAKAGRSFDCHGCKVAAKRRCGEDRWDFTDADDSAIFPIQVSQGGETYGFCPAKATWDTTVTTLFRSMHVAATTGVMWEDGGIKDQPTWWIDLLSWFIQRHDAENFSSKARSVLGDGSTKSKGGALPNGSVSRKPKR